jgi:hypothetical protein
MFRFQIVHPSRPQHRGLMLSAPSWPTASSPSGRSPRPIVEKAGPFSSMSGPSGSECRCSTSSVYRRGIKESRRGPPRRCWPGSVYNALGPPRSRAGTSSGPKEQAQVLINLRFPRPGSWRICRPEPEIFEIDTRTPSISVPWCSRTCLICHGDRPPASLGQHQGPRRHRCQMEGWKAERSTALRGDLSLTATIRR